MIKATEARELVKLSDANTDRLLKWIDPQIRKLAEEGKNVLNVYSEELLIRGEGVNCDLTSTPLMNKVLEKLKTFGYRAEFIVEKNDNKFPGLGVYDEDDYKNRQPTYKKFIKLSW